MNDIIYKNGSIVFPSWISYLLKDYEGYNLKRRNHFLLFKFKNYFVDYDINHVDNKIHHSLDNYKFIYKNNNRYEVVNEINLNYQIYYKDGFIYILVNLNFYDNMRFLNINTDLRFNGLINKLLNSDIYYINNTSEFCYPVSMSDDLKIKYYTESKYAEYIYNGEVNTDKYLREISLSKVLIKYCNIHENEVSKVIERIKTINKYDANSFQIVTGNDILTYYNSDNYFNTSGSLGGSCMKTAKHKSRLLFYTKNSNISLIIFKLDNKILGRALLWTTITGEKVMDRIYVTDDKIISHFHKFAEENNFLNIYDFKTPMHPKVTKFQMAPGNWLHQYKTNFIVDLEYLPYFHFSNKLYVRSILRDKKFLLETSFSKSQTLGNEIQPYLDNFCYVNYFTKQISNLPLQDFYKCPLSKTYINSVYNILEFKNKLYNSEFVTIVDDKPVLIKTLVNTSEEIPLEINTDITAEISIVFEW